MAGCTIRGVARAAGVSRLTVSRVLSDAAASTPATRQRVREEMQRPGYRPDASLVVRDSTVRGTPTADAQYQAAVETEWPPE